MIRRCVLPIVVVLAACAVQPPASAPPPAPAKQCRIGPDGGPVVADRGIGGTGIRPTTPALVAGTDGDRGIGGTGIVGVVTGFASVCVAGTEVAYNSATPATVDGVPIDPDTLRVGQVVAIEATGPDDALVARTINVQHQLVGPIDAIASDGAVMTVAGQRVLVDSSTPGAGELKQGDWIAVSGLLGPAGAIHATRIDRAPLGPVMVRGVLRGSTLAPRLGLLRLKLDTAPAIAAGTPVIVSGHYVGGALLAEHVEPDLLASNPPAFFGGAPRRYRLESYVVAGGDRIKLSGGFEIPSRVSGPTDREPSRAIVLLQQTPSGVLNAVGVTSPGAPTAAPSGSDVPLSGSGRGASGGGSPPFYRPPAPGSAPSGGAGSSPPAGVGGGPFGLMPGLGLPGANTGPGAAPAGGAPGSGPAAGSGPAPGGAGPGPAGGHH